MDEIFNISNLNSFFKQYPQKSNKISPFIDEGVFLTHKPPINHNYTIDNFEYVTDYSKEAITIGRGGYGKLYLARNKKDNKEYAIKYVSKKKMKSLGVEPSIIKREIDIHIRITHPRIIKLYSYLEDRHNFYLAMEYAPKGNLYQLIQQKKGMSENEAFYYFIQVASAIHFLHINGYAHRDIKPENILIDKNGGIKLCDFGWCVNVAKGERITFCGTYEYMAPEMINDEFYDMGIDVWSLGVLLYEMIHGYSPFRAHYYVKDAKSAMTEIFINIKNNNYTINKDISDECIDLIDKLLTTDTKQRIKIGELFLHPWVVNKEKEYFPSFKRIKEIKINNHNNNYDNNYNNNYNNNYDKNYANNFNNNYDNNCNNNYNNKNYNTFSNRIREKDINCMKSAEYGKSKNKEKGNGNDIYESEINDNKENKRIINIDMEKKYNMTNYPMHVKNKSYCLVTNKSNSNNNGIYFIRDKSEKKNAIEDKHSKQEKENDKNNFDYINKYYLTEQNELLDKNKKGERNELSPGMEKKDLNSKNNFIVNINSNNSNRKKINLPKVVRTEKKLKENLVINTNQYDNQDINTININLTEKYKSKKSVEKSDGKNYSKNKSNKKPTIRVQRQDLDDHLKKQREDEELNLKMQKIKEQQEITINKLKKIDEKKRREESLQKMYESQKSNTSYDYYSKNKSLKNQLSMNKIQKGEIGSYIIKTFKKDNENKNNKSIKYKEKLKDKRSKSFQQLLNENSLENKLTSLFREKNRINKNYNFMTNENFNYKNLKKDLNQKNSFKRFTKKVVHLKKRNNIKTEENLYKSIETLDKNLKDNKNIKASSIQQIYLKPNKSIQNIFFNTFYNCLFDNNQNINSSKGKNYYLNNMYEPKKNILNLKNNKELKSISSEKKIFKNRNILKYISKKDNLNKENILSNYNSERKGKFYSNRLESNEIKNKSDKNKPSYIYLNYKNSLINSNKKRSLSNTKEIL